MKDTLVLCVTHKKFDDTIIPECYHVICVGNGISDEDAQQPGYLKDNTGTNISVENPYYCELTAQYWGWKNLPPEIQYIGICHYRRYFFDYQKGSKTIRDDILSENRIKDILRNHKMIMSIPTVKYPGMGSLYKGVPDSEQDMHWVIIRDIIYKDYPEFRDSFDQVVYGRMTIWGNMLVTTRKIYDEYSQWLFDILMKYDQVIRERGLERIPRVDGFLAEQLLCVYTSCRFSKKEIYRLEVRNTETDTFIDYRQNFAGKLFHFLREHRFTLLVMRYVRIIVLLIMRKDRRK